LQPHKGACSNGVLRSQLLLVTCRTLLLTFPFLTALTVPFRPYPPRTPPAAWRVRSCSHSHQECADRQEIQGSSARPDKLRAGHHLPSIGSLLRGPFGR